MNTINRSYYPASGLSAQGVNPQSDSPPPSGLKSGHDSKLIDFGPPQQTTGLQSPPNSLGSRPQTPASNTSSGTTESPVELLLNKLVEAIRNILKDLFSGSSSNQQKGSTPPPAQTQREQAPTSPQSSSTTPAASPSSPSVAQGKPEKPFVVQNDYPMEKPVTLQKNTAATPPDTSPPAGKTPDKPTAAGTPATHDLLPPKASTPAIEPSDAAEKVAKSATRYASGPGADMSGMVGFARQANTTGGNNGKVVTVNTVADLKKYMEDDTARTVKLGANLSADSKVTINFGANKTLLGSDKGNSLHNIYLASSKTASNDIFQNLNFTHDSRYRENGDMQMFISSGQKYWIDHNTYTGTKDQNPKGLDKLLYVGGTADNVSLTNSKFKNNEYGVILGQPDDSPAAKAAYAGYPRMTIANNVFSNLDVRAPGLMRHGDFDVFNNSIDNFHLGFTATGDANILSQSNYFGNGVDTSHKPSNRGVLDDYGDAHFKDIGSNATFTQKSPVTVWTPSYHRDIKTAEQAKAYDLANAGAKPVN
ncbi:type III helper protein HopAK1 [Pseudomonas syringae CC1557]|uniref:Type III helper protein HopAK1 n=1 Tax=Pseudomonas syringae CC1557 TaxID=1357279 RepID=W0MRK3_PSESX|nr:type III helper protein HopAK1 [Pseudomonas syringae]AHG39880.1 type III helper protein HopAK1 [Pseudomonas syringae CC1557]